MLRSLMLAVNNRLEAGICNSHPAGLSEPWFPVTIATLIVPPFLQYLLEIFSASGRVNH